MVDHSTLGWLWRRTGCGTADRPTHRLAVRFLGEAAVDRLIVLDGRASTSGPNWWCARSAAAAAASGCARIGSSARPPRIGSPKLVDEFDVDGGVLQTPRQEQGQWIECAGRAHPLRRERSLMRLFDTCATHPDIAPPAIERRGDDFRFRGGEQERAGGKVVVSLRLWRGRVLEPGVEAGRTSGRDSIRRPARIGAGWVGSGCDKTVSGKPLQLVVEPASAHLNAGALLVLLHDAIPVTSGAVSEQAEHEVTVQATFRGVRLSRCGLSMGLALDTVTPANRCGVCHVFSLLLQRV